MEKNGLDVVEEKAIWTNVPHMTQLTARRPSPRARPPTIVCYCGTREVVKNIRSKSVKTKCSSPCGGDPDYACGGKAYASMYNMPLGANDPLTQTLVKGTSKSLGCYARTAKNINPTINKEMTNEVNIGRYIVVD